MKRILIAATAAIASALVWAGTPVSPNSIPKEARTFLNSHFKGDAVVTAERDRDLLGVTYDVNLRSGIEVDFDDKGTWTEVKAEDGARIPDSFVPDAILEYVRTTHGSTIGINEISKERRGYEVELTNGLEYFISADAKRVRRITD